MRTADPPKLRDDTRTRLAKLLGMVGSSHDAEALAAARMADKLVIQPDIDPERPLQPLFYTRTTAASGGASAIFYDVGVAAEWRSDAQET